MEDSKQEKDSTPAQDAVDENPQYGICVVCYQEFDPVTMPSGEQRFCSNKQSRCKDTWFNARNRALKKWALEQLTPEEADELTEIEIHEMISKKIDEIPSK